MTRRATKAIALFTAAGLATSGCATMGLVSSNMTVYERKVMACVEMVAIGAIGGAIIAGKGDRAVGALAGAAVGGLVCDALIDFDTPENKLAAMGAEHRARESGQVQQVKFRGKGGQEGFYKVVPTNVSDPASGGRFCRRTESSLTVGNGAPSAMGTQIVCRNPDGTYTAVETSA
jgi:surface antigen